MVTTKIIYKLLDAAYKVHINAVRYVEQLIVVL